MQERDKKKAEYYVEDYWPFSKYNNAHRVQHRFITLTMHTECSIVSSPPGNVNTKYIRQGLFEKEQGGSFKLIFSVGSSKSVQS